MTRDQLAVIKKDVVDVVEKKVQQFTEQGELHLPANYSAANSLKSAWLILQETKDKNGKPVLQSCTHDSIANSLLNMIVQGLNPAKKQGYFIPYGTTLTFQRSYFGTMAVTKQVTNARDIYAQVIYKQDSFEYEIKHGKKHIIKHTQGLANMKNEDVIGAYCVIELGDENSFTDILTIDQLKTAWKQSQMKPIDEKGNIKTGSTHEKFTADMAIKTVINHACKYYLNSSDDSSLVMKAFKMSDEEVAEARVQEEIEENANTGEVIDVSFDQETGELKEEQEEDITEETQQKLEKRPGF